MQSQVNAVVMPEAYSEEEQELNAAYTFFSETSHQLAQSYRHLEKQVQQLNLALEQERKKTEQTESRMQALLNFLPGGIIVLDAKGYVLEANPAARELLKSELEGRLWRDAIQECFSPKNDDGLEVSTCSGRRISIATSSFGNDGQIILLTDQTDTRKLQESLSHYEKLSAMGKMVSALAHQIRTPLSAAMLYAGHLCSENISLENRDKFSHKLYSRLQHMEKQVRDMMLFVKSELPLNDIVSLVDIELGLREAAEVALSTSHALCQWNNNYPNKRIKCHREALISALMNLINNSIQACDSTPILYVDMDCCYENGEEHVVIKVKDSGQGIDPDVLAKAHEMFVTTKAQGTGLGLSVVQSVARAHGGSFNLSSEPGVGTEAFIKIPVLQNTSLAG